MARIPVFYSFHFDNDVMRVQQVRNIGALDGNSPASPNQWEKIQYGGDAAIRGWIDDNMKYKRCLVVLVGTETANRPWVQYEIKKAWGAGKGVVGVHIHNLKCPRGGACRKGPNPFGGIALPDGRPLSSVVSCHDPSSMYALTDIQLYLESWIQAAIDQRSFS